MTRITGFNPPPAIATLLQGSLHINRASRCASAAAYPTRRPLKPHPARMRWSHPLNMGQVADWLITHGPARWRAGSRPVLRVQILHDLARRTFAAEFWTAATPATDRIEVAYPSVDRGASPPPDPTDPTASANSDCGYAYRSAYWPFAQASAGGWPPLPGWAGALDADRYFVDAWHAHRALTYPFPPLTVPNQRAFVLLHLRGSIRASAEESGVRLWFAPLPVASFHATPSAAANAGSAIGGNWTHLLDPNLALPPPRPGWSHTVPVDLVFKLAAGGWSETCRWLNLKLSSRAPCGKYRAANAWAQCQVDLQVRVFYPTFLTL